MFTLQTKFSIVRGIITKNSPFYIQFYVSNRCHQKCKMCNIVNANKKIAPIKSELIDKIADNLVKIGAGIILLTGGEPFLRDDIDKIVYVFKKKKLDVRLQTAGLIYKKNKIKECFDNGASDINVSLDSLDEKLSDNINGLKGSWNNTLKTISFISKNIPKKDAICAIGCVLSNYNLNEIEPLLVFATKIGWWFSLVPVHISQSDKMNFRGHDKSFIIDDKNLNEIRDIISRLKMMKRNGYNLFDSDEYLDSVYSFISTGKPLWRTHNLCDSPNLYFAILPDGSFAPCCDYQMKKKYYLYDKDFPSIYNSKRFKNEVKNITSKCPGCNFGSYPEMSLTVRNLSTLKERFSLQINTKRKIIALEEKEIFKIINDIKKDFPFYKTIN